MGTVPHLFFEEPFSAVGVGKISAGQSPGLVPVITTEDPVNGYVLSVHHEGKQNKIIILALLAVLLAGNLFFIFKGLPFDLEWLQANQKTIEALSSEYFLASILLFVLLRFVFAVVSIPGTGVLTIAGGAVFGVWLGSLLAALAVGCGVTVVFLMSRYALKDYVRSRFESYTGYIEKGMQEYGTGFLFMLRIIEVAPSFVINSVFAFTDMKVKTFFLVSLAGFLPGIFIFANAGSRLAQIDAMSCLMSTGVMLSLAVTIQGVLGGD